MDFYEKSFQQKTHFSVENFSLKNPWWVLKIFLKPLDNSLGEHGFSHFHEAGHVGALDIVHAAVGLLAILNAGLVDGMHDGMEFLVHLLGRPADVHRVLGHLQTGGRHATRVHGLAGSEEDAGLLEGLDSTGLAAHVGHLGAKPRTVGKEFLRILAGKLVLEGARHGDVALHAPGLLARDELGIRELLRSRPSCPG